MWGPDLRNLTLRETDISEKVTLLEGDFLGKFSSIFEKFPTLRETFSNFFCRNLTIFLKLVNFPTLRESTFNFFFVNP